jgi:ElaB/YqjD/DUF883 family membrane-anchored ribosome-binding protein
MERGLLFGNCHVWGAKIWLTKSSEEGLIPMETTRDMKTATGDGASQGRSEVEELRRQLKDLKDRYGSQAEGRLRQAKQSVRENLNDIELQVRDRPVQATLMAAALGFLIGALVSRR